MRQSEGLENREINHKNLENWWRRKFDEQKAISLLNSDNISGNFSLAC